MRAKVLSNSFIKGSYYKLSLKPPCNIKVLPGQFLMIKPGEKFSPSDPILPRPFSIHRLTPDGNIEILYKVVGKGTTLLSYIDAGDEIEILGPLGNGFSANSGDSAEEILIVAGGIGVAPLLGLAEVFRVSYPEKSIIVFLGGRGEVDLLCVEDLKRVATKVILVTQDGSIGREGYVTEALEEFLHQRHGSRTDLTLYACGPSPMLQRVLELTKPFNMATYFSLEATMACGIGICMGCAIKKTEGGYYLVCKDGPVFKGDLIDFHES